MAEDFNKLDLLIKMMGMTASDNDNQRLVAISKANAMLKAEGWDWDKLLRGKVKIIADPFTKVSAPPPQAKPAPMSRPTPPPRPAPPPKPAWTPPPAAPDPFAGLGGAPRRTQQQKAAQHAQNYGAASPPPQANKPKPQAPAGPLQFRRQPSGEWTIASHIRLDNQLGQQVTIEKRNGDKVNEVVGPFVEQDTQGYYRYKIAKTSKWKTKFADAHDINDII